MMLLHSNIDFNFNFSIPNINCTLLAMFYGYFMKALFINQVTTLYVDLLGNNTTGNSKKEWP